MKKKYTRNLVPLAYNFSKENNNKWITIGKQNKIPGTKSDDINNYFKHLKQQTSQIK